MENFLQQIESALDAGLCYLALAGALVVPDMCAALQSKDGRTNGKQYAAVFDKYLGEKYSRSMTGTDCYQIRCRILHQGTLHDSDNKSSYYRYVFDETNKYGNVNHLNSVVVSANGRQLKALKLDTRVFCLDIVNAAREWLSDNEDTPNYKKNYDLFMRRHPNGQFMLNGVEFSFLVGEPIIA